MAGAGEHVHGAGADGPVAQLREELHIPAQGGGVAGDVHHPLRPHGRHGGDDLRAEALAGRVHGNDVRPQAVLLQLGGDVRRVTAEKLRVFNAVAGRVLFGVRDGGGHDLRADDLFGLRRHTEGDGAGAAVQVQHRLLPRQPGEFQGLAVQHLRLVPVHLVKRGDGQLEPEAAEGVHQEILPPEGAVLVPQDDVALFCIRVQHHAHGPGRRRPDEGRQLRLPGQLLAIGHHAAKALALPVHPDVEVPHQTLAGALVIGGNFIPPHPVPHGLGRFVGDLRLDEAAVHSHHLVAAGLVKADGASGAHGVLALVAVVGGVLGPQNLLHLEVRAPQAGQGVLDPLALGPQLLRVAHVLEVTAAALAEIGTLRLRPLRGGLAELHHLAGGAGLHDLCDAQVDLLAPHGPGDEHHGAVQAHDAKALTGVALHGAGIDAVFF